MTIALRRYVTAVRRSIYEDEAASKRAREVRHRRRYLVSIVGPWLQYAKPIVRPIARLGRRVLHFLRLSWVATFGRLSRAILASLYMHRHAIRRLAQLLISYNSDLSKISFGFGVVGLSYRLIELRIPVVSRLTRRAIELSLAGALSAQMAAGNIGNTLLLARLINLAFRPYIRERQPLSFLYFQALFHSQQYNRIVAEVTCEEMVGQHYLSHIVGVAFLYSNNLKRARHYLRQAISLNDQHSTDHRMLGRAYLLAGDQSQAARCFERAVSLAPKTVMAHQNYAGRYDIPRYEPKGWELEQAGRILIYDNYAQLAEDFFLLGRHEESLRLYQKMQDYQETLRAPLPPDLVTKLAALDHRFDPAKPVRLLSYEWVTQFGHLGLLDTYVKMIRLGMYRDANHVLLAPDEKVSNRNYLGYWEEHFTIVRDRELVDELFPYQRMLGDGFMAYRGSDGITEYWTRAGASAQIAWAREARAPLLALSEMDREIGRRSLETLGVPADAWYVGLHAREGGYYGESSGGMSTHRNAQIVDYFPAIKAVTERGGYVIRLGDSSMEPLPKMPRVIDYALSPSKSLQGDIFFCASSRFVIGTTSGLTTACLSFGTPMVLVNCISSDWQLWSRDTDFIVKPVWDLHSGRFLSLAETYTPPVQGYLINTRVMRQHGLVAVANTPEDIAAAVIYKLDLMDGPITAPDDGSEPIQAYRATMTHNPMMFGAARPVPDFMKNHPELLTTNWKVKAKEVIQ